MSRRVLVVEDDHHNSAYYRAVLVANGYSIEIVRDGTRVMNRVREFNPDIITMDIKLPGISGLDLIKDLLRDEKLCRIPILAITVLTGHEIETQIRDAGARGYVNKPVSIKRLLTEIASLLPA